MVLKTKVTGLANEIFDIFKIHIIHSSTSKTNYHFDYLPILKFPKEKPVGQDFKDIF